MNKKVKIGLVGAGGIAEFSHMPGIVALENAELAAVCDVVEERARKAASLYNVKEWYTDYHEMLKKSDIEAVDVCTPVFLHAQIAVDALNSGMHVLIEKPMARNYKEGETIVNASKKNRRQISAMFNMRYMPANLQIKNAIEKQELGKIYTARIRDGHSGPENIMPYMASWIFNKEKSGGGCIIDEIHDIDLLCWWLGEVDSVSAELGTLAKKIDVEDNAAVVLRFKSGAIASMEISWSQIAGSGGTEIYGEKGVVLSGDSYKIFKTETGGWFMPDLPSQPYWYWHRLQIKDFAQALLENKRVPIPGEEALERLKIIDSIYLASETGKKIIIN
jgi:predicted dehydrogenase